jgi:tRNA threonylcarbamoyl adenosine modification protein YeaZ
MLLALDTATQAVTVAMADGAQVIAGSTTVDALRHGELLAPAIADVMAEAQVEASQLTRIAVGVGPGPFTGLRVGLVTARTMGAVLGIPVVGICTLDVLAAAVGRNEPFLVATDARRKEVYWARYAASGARHTEPTVDKPDVVATDEPVAGRGATMYPEAFANPIAPEYPDAADLARLVLSGTAAELPPEPLYLRRPDVAEPGVRKRVS